MRYAKFYWKDIKQAQAHSFWMEIFSMGRMRTVSKFTCNFKCNPTKSNSIFHGTW